MMQVISPRQWVRGELEKLLQLTAVEGLTEEEKLILVKSRICKFLADINNPLMYKQDLI